MSVDLLQTPIEFLKGVGPKRGELLRKDASVSTYYDMLTYYPFRHVDRSRFMPIAEINSENIYLQIRGKIVDVQLLGQGGFFGKISRVRMQVVPQGRPEAVSQGGQVL